MSRVSPRKRSAAPLEMQTESLNFEKLNGKKIRKTRSRKIPAITEKEEEESHCGEGPSSSSIQDIRRKLDSMISRQEDKEELIVYLDSLKNDSRAGIIALVADARNSLLCQEVEKERLQVMMQFETKAFKDHIDRQQSHTKARKKNSKLTSKDKEDFYLIGVDEVGVGPLAGPIVSCAIAFKYTVLRENLLPLLNGIDDSKKISAAKREALAEILKSNCLDYYFGIVTSSEVDELNPLQGSLIAMKRAVKGLQLLSQQKENPSNIDIFVDHHTIPDLDINYRQTSITKGDSKSIIIAAASILAKVYRDEYMTHLHQQYPNFAFDRNAGYGTKDHLDQLRKGKLCPEHRLSYQPVRQAHRISMGLPVDKSPKKKTRASSRSVSPIKLLAIQSKPTIGRSERIVATSDATLHTAPASIFSLSWWGKVFSSLS